MATDRVGSGNGFVPGGDGGRGGRPVIVGSRGHATEADDDERPHSVGMELGGGFKCVRTKLGLSIEARERYLLAHQKSAFDEWGQV